MSQVETLFALKLDADGLGRKTVPNMLLIQPGDVPATSFADAHNLMRAVGQKPGATRGADLARFVDWHREY